MLVPLALVAAIPSLMDRTVVVVNANSPVSIAVAADYMKLRKVRQKIVVHCQDSATSSGNETISYANFQPAVEAPMRDYLAKHPEIDFVVLTKGVPIRITDAPGFGISNKQPSVDSYLAALDYASMKPIKVALSDSGFTGTAWANRFWDAKERFTHKKFGGYLVTRLDGYSEEDAKMLVRWSLAAEKKRPTGTILLDTCPSFGYDDPAKEPLPIFNGKPDPANGAKSLNEIAYKHYNSDMDRAGEELSKRGIPVQLERTDLFVQGSDLMGYCSWGSNDSHFDAGNYAKLRFAPGALAETAVSTSARTFLHTSGGQSLIADLVAGNVTGVKGYCDEPLLQAVASPTILFDRYTRGWTLVESFYAASRFIGWEDIILGDPLCRPYRQVP
jgi:uncharacterized protein (TIGR03790 family)